MQTQLKKPWKKPDTKIKVFWQLGHTVSRWDEMCVWLIEQIGLPNYDTYECSFTEDYLEINFADEKDAVHFALRWL